MILERNKQMKKRSCVIEYRKICDIEEGIVDKREGDGVEEAGKWFKLFCKER